MTTSLSMSKEFLSRKNYETEVWGMCQNFKTKTQVNSKISEFKSYFPLIFYVKIGIFNVSANSAKNDWFPGDFLCQTSQYSWYEQISAVF